VDKSTQVLYIHLAIWIALFVVAYFLVAFNVGKKKEDKEQVRLNRMKRDYFELKHGIEICCNENTLMLFEVSMDQFFERYHVSGKKNKELLQYYTFLLRASSEKRNEFNGIQEVTA